MWGPIPNSSAPTVISIVISLGKQGTVSPLRNKPLQKKSQSAKMSETFV